MDMPETVKANRKMGRPSKLTPEVQKTIVNAIRVGNYIETAAALAGIRKDALYDWMRQGANASRGKFKEFSDAVKKAVAESEARDLSVIDRAADGWDKTNRRAVTKKNSKTGQMEVIEQVVEQTREFSWTAAAWRLERKFPNKWGRRDHVELSGDQDNPIQVQQQIDAYDGKTLARILVAFAEAQLIPSEIIAAIDVTPQNGSGGNGGSNGAAE